MKDPWLIVEESFDVRLNRHYEGLMAIGSGPLQQRAALEEGLADDPPDVEYLRIMGNVTAEQFPDFKSRAGTYLPGVTGPHPTCRDEMINLPSIHGLLLEVAGEKLDMQKSRISAYRRELDLRNGHLRRDLVWESHSGARLRVEFERFICAARPHLLVQRCRISHQAGPAAVMRVTASIDARVRTNGFDHFTGITPLAYERHFALVVHTNGGDEVAAVGLLTADRDEPVAARTDEQRSEAVAEVHLDPGKSVTLQKLVAMTSTKHTHFEPLGVARSILDAAAEKNFAELAAESDRVWQDRWAASDVEISGDDASQHAIRVSLYHLMRAAVEDSPRVAIDAKGAAGEAYCGRYFWDTEIFMLPMFLYTRPRVGKMLARFRHATLPGARRNARRYGYSGAKYAWESAPSGDDHCPNWQYADHEIHVSADAAYGLWHAHLVDPDDLGLLREATEVLTETSRYWCERVHRDAECDEYELLMVMGPDEYTPFSRNNAYTNHMAALTLRLARTAWEALMVRDLAAADALRETLKLQDDELERFAHVAARLRFPYDHERRLVLQSDDFFGYEPLDLARWWPDRSRGLASAVSQERLYRSRVLKQADVVQLMALFPQQFDAEQMRVAFETYEPLTSHDSSLSRPIHAIVAAWLGKADDAKRFWDESAGLDLQPGAAAEGIHAACAGANWQVLVFGFAGIRTRMQSDRLWIDPRLPAGWQALRFPFVWRGQALRITIEPQRVTVEHRGSAPLEAHVCGRDVQLGPGTTGTIDY